MTSLMHDGWCLLLALGRVALPLVWPALLLSIVALILQRLGRRRREARPAGEQGEQ